MENGCCDCACSGMSFQAIWGTDVAKSSHSRISIASPKCTLCEVSHLFTHVGDRLLSQPLHCQHFYLLLCVQCGVSIDTMVQNLSARSHMHTFLTRSLFHNFNSSQHFYSSLAFLFLYDALAQGISHLRDNVEGLFRRTFL